MKASQRNLWGFFVSGRYNLFSLANNRTANKKEA
jgi:hypothetical protein